MKQNHEINDQMDSKTGSHWEGSKIHLHVFRKELLCIISVIQSNLEL